MNPELWYIEAQAAERLQAAGLRVNQATLELRPEKEGPAYQNINGTAVIDITGIITPAPTFWGAIFGDESTHGRIRAGLTGALADEAIDRILLRIDSPGGDSAGLQGLADDVWLAGKEKPVYAFTEGMMASAAYFLGSQALELFVSPEGAVGSIGCWIALYDYSELFKKEGVKPDPIVSGPKKATGMLGTSLSKEQRAYLQTMVDDTATVFKRAVVRGRPLTERQVEKLADGGLLVGERAVAARLADRVATLRTILGELGVDDQAVEKAGAGRG